MTLWKVGGALLCALACVWGATASAQEVRLQIDEQRAAELGVDTTNLESDINGAAGGDLRLDGQELFLQQMADAGILSVKGMGVDYATNPQKFVVGGSAGSAVNSAGFAFGRGDNPLPSGGFAFQLGGMAGLNLGLASKNEKSAARRFMIYANGMAGNTGKEPFAATFWNVGGHLQIKLIKGFDESVVEMGGLDLTTGFEMTHYEMSLNQALPMEGDGATWEADGTYVVSATGRSIPVELSTNLRVAVVTGFFGFGVDVNQLAEADSDINLDGPITAEADGQSADIGSAQITHQQAGFGTDYHPRFFGGLQLNALMIKAYGQLNVTVDGGVGGHFGARVAM